MSYYCPNSDCGEQLWSFQIDSGQCPYCGEHFSGLDIEEMNDEDKEGNPKSLDFTKDIL